MVRFDSTGVARAFVVGSATCPMHGYVSQVSRVLGVVRPVHSACYPPASSLPRVGVISRRLSQPFSISYVIIFSSLLIQVP